MTNYSHTIATATSAKDFRAAIQRAAIADAAIDEAAAGETIRHTVTINGRSVGYEAIVAADRATVVLISALDNAAYYRTGTARRTMRSMDDLRGMVETHRILKTLNSLRR